MGMGLRVFFVDDNDGQHYQPINSTLFEVGGANGLFPPPP